MNYVIDKLKAEAGIDDKIDHEDLDLFARLIIEECLHRVQKCNGFIENTKINNEDTVMLMTGTCDIVKNYLKNYFEGTNDV